MSQLPARAGPGPGGAARGARRDERDRRRRGQAPPAAAVGERADPPRRGRRARARSSSSRRSPTPGSDLARERAKVAHLRAALEIGDDALRRGLLRRRAHGGAAAPDPELLALAREAAGAPTRRTRDFPVGAALRTTDGRRYAGANVENAAYPQGQCAEASAIGAFVAGGGGRIAEVVVAAPSRELCTPCGGCRQRLREFAARRRADPPRRPRARPPHDVARRAAAAVLRPGAPRGVTDAADVVAGRAPRLRRRALGADARLGARRARRRGSPTAVAIPYGELPGFHAGGLAGHAGRARARPARGRRRWPSSRAAGTSTRASTASAITTPIRTLKALGAETLVLTNAAGSLRPEAGPGSLVVHRPTTSTCIGFNPLTGPNDEADGPRFPSLRDAYDPELRAPPARARPTRSAIALHDGVYLAVAGPELRDAGRDPRVPHARRRPRRHEHGARGDRRPPRRACASPRSRPSPTSRRAWAARSSATSRRCASPRRARRDLGPAARALRGGPRPDPAGADPPQARRRRADRRGDRLPRAAGSPTAGSPTARSPRSRWPSSSATSSDAERVALTGAMTRSGTCCEWDDGPVRRQALDRRRGRQGLAAPRADAWPRAAARCR